MMTIKYIPTTAVLLITFLVIALVSHRAQSNEMPSFYDTMALAQLKKLIMEGKMNEALTLRNKVYSEIMRNKELIDEQKYNLINEQYNALFEAGKTALYHRDLVLTNHVVMWLASLGAIIRAKKLYNALSKVIARDKGLTPKQKKIMFESQLETIYLQGIRALYTYKNYYMLDEIIDWLNEHEEGKPWAQSLLNDYLKEKTMSGKPENNPEYREGEPQTGSSQQEYPQDTSVHEPKDYEYQTEETETGNDLLWQQPMQTTSGLEED